MKIILASRSPRRKSLFSQTGIPFRTVSSSVSEDTHLKRPASIVKSLALRKAMNVSRRYPENPVLGADTIVVCGSKIIGKPKTPGDALRFLRILNGKWQSVYTGVAVVWIKKGKKAAGCAVSRCKTRRLSEKELRNFAGKHMDKAGAYAVQDFSDPFIEKIRGSYDNVVGLPVSLAMKLLRKTGYKPPA